MGPKGGVLGLGSMTFLEGGRPEMCRAARAGYILLGALVFRKNWYFFLFKLSVGNVRYGTGITHGDTFGARVFIPMRDAYVSLGIYLILFSNISKVSATFPNQNLD